MPSFAYSAINAQGAELSGEIQATDLAAARDALRGNGLMAQRLEEISAQPSRHRAARSSASRRRQSRPKSLQIFSRQFATMIEAGLSVVTALVILEQQTEDKALAEVIDDVRERVEGGALLSEGWPRTRMSSRASTSRWSRPARQPVCSTSCSTGSPIQIEKEEKIKRRVKGAMIYPSVVLTFAFLVLTGLLMFLVPVFVKIFDQLGGQLPKLTQIILHLSNGLRHSLVPRDPDPRRDVRHRRSWRRLLWFKRWKRTDKGRAAWDSFKLRIPMQIGAGRAQGRDGALLAHALDADRVRASTSSAPSRSPRRRPATGSSRRDTMKIREMVREGAPIAQPMIASPVFPPMVGAHGQDR